MEITTKHFKDHQNALKGIETCRTYFFALQDGVIMKKIKDNTVKCKDIKERMKKYFPGGIIDKFHKGKSIYIMASIFLDFLPEQYEVFIFIYSVSKHWEFVPKEYEKVLSDGIKGLLLFTKDVEDGGIPEYKEEFHKFLSQKYDEMKEEKKEGEDEKTVILETPPRKKHVLEPPVLKRTSNADYPLKRAKGV